MYRFCFALVKCEMSAFAQCVFHFFPSCVPYGRAAICIGGIALSTEIET